MMLIMHDSKCSEKVERLDTLIEEEKKVDAKMRNERMGLPYINTAEAQQRMPCRNANRMRIGRTTGPGWQSKAQKNGRAFNASVIKVRIVRWVVNQASLYSPRRWMKGLPQVNDGRL
jgi:hypothetical protein